MKEKKEKKEEVVDTEVVADENVLDEQEEMEAEAEVQEQLPFPDAQCTHKNRKLFEGTNMCKNCVFK